MPRIVRCGLIQARNVLGPEAGLPAIKKAMLDKHLKLIAEAAAKKAKILCLQEIFYGPYFCAEQETRWYHLTERVPDGPTVTLMRKLAKKHRMVMVVPIYEEEQAGRLLQHRGGDRRRREVPRQVPEDPHPALASPASGRSSTSAPATSAIPVFETAYAKIGVYICYDRHFPEGARALGLAGAEIVFNPSATVAGLSEYLWELEQPAHAVANGYFVGAINRVGIEAPWKIGRVLRQELLLRPARQDRGPGPARQGRGGGGRPQPRHDRRGALDLAVLPRPPARRLRPARRALTPRSATWVSTQRTRLGKAPRMTPSWKASASEARASSRSAGSPRNSPPLARDGVPGVLGRQAVDDFRCRARGGPPAPKQVRRLGTVRLRRPARPAPGRRTASNRPRAPGWRAG